MHTRLFSAISAATFLALGVSAAHANMESCVSNYVRPDTSVNYRDGGTKFSMSDVLPLTRTAAFTKVYQGLIGEGYQITSSDRDMGAIGASAQIHDNGLRGPFAFRDTGVSTQVLNVLIEPVSEGTKVTLTVSYRRGLKVHESPNDYCNFIESLGSN